MERDLSLSSSDYSLALSIFFVVSRAFKSIPAPGPRSSSTTCFFAGLPTRRSPLQHASRPIPTFPLPSRPHVRLGSHVSRSQGNPQPRRTRRIQVHARDRRSWVLPGSHLVVELLVQGELRPSEGSSFDYGFRGADETSPGLLLQPNELSKRLAIFYSAALMAGAFGGLLAGVITQYMDGVGNTPGWQWVSQRRPPPPSTSDR